MVSTFAKSLTRHLMCFLIDSCQLMSRCLQPLLLPCSPLPKPSTNNSLSPTTNTSFHPIPLSPMALEPGLPFPFPLTRPSMALLARPTLLRISRSSPLHPIPPPPHKAPLPNEHNRSPILNPFPFRRSHQIQAIPNPS